MNGKGRPLKARPAQLYDVRGIGGGPRDFVVTTAAGDRDVRGCEGTSLAGIGYRHPCNDRNSVTRFNDLVNTRIYGKRFGFWLCWIAATGAAGTAATAGGKHHE